MRYECVDIHATKQVASCSWRDIRQTDLEYRRQFARYRLTHGTDYGPNKLQVVTSTSNTDKRKGRSKG